jgi:hypothetical protein
MLEVRCIGEKSHRQAILGGNTDCVDSTRAPYRDASKTGGRAKSFNHCALFSDTEGNMFELRSRGVL